MRDREADPQTIRATEAYQELIRRRRRLLLATGLPPFVLLMALTGFTVFTDLLDEQLVPGLNLAILLAYVVFFAPVVAAHVYIARVRVLDALAERALTEAYTPTGGRA